MSPPLQHIQTSPTPPACADVVVIGGGIIGVFTAYYLARRGVSVDEAEISRWASWRDFAKTAGVTTHMPEKAAPAVAAALVRLGRSVHQNCAAHGIEMEGGRVSGVITEAGVIKTKTAVLAGGAWASSFCRQLGIRFPQASIRQSILSVSPVAHRLPDALVSANVSATRRNDGRYALAISGRARVDVTPQFMRFAPQFVPMFAKRWRNLRPGSLEGIRGGHETLARWRLDAPTPMERVRILDPKADLPIDPGDPPPPGIHPGRGLFRARLRHRRWRRPFDRGPGRRRRADRGSAAVSAGTLQRLGMGQGR